MPSQSGSIPISAGHGDGENVNKAPGGLLRQLLVPFNLERVGCQFGGERGEDK